MWRHVWCGLLLGGSLWAISIDTDFEDAGVNEVHADHHSQTLHFIPAASGQNQQYWYFRISGLDPKRELTLQTARNEWIPKHACYSADGGKTWHLTAEGQAEQERWNYKITPAAATLLFASQPPLGLGQIHAGLEQLRKLTPSTDVSIFLQEEDAQMLPMLRLCEGDQVEARRHGVLLQAGFDSADMASRWAALGFARWVTGSALDAVWLRQNCETFVVPVNAMIATTGVRSEMQTPSPSHEAATRQLLDIFRTDQRRFLHVEIRTTGPDAGAIRMDFPENQPESFRRALGSAFGDILPVEIRTAKTDRLQLFIPWNHDKGTSQTYEKLGAHLAAAMAAHLQHPKEK